MNSSLSNTLVICGTVLIVSPWAGIVANVMALGKALAARSDVTSLTIGSDGAEPFGIACSIVGVVMIVFACWKSRRSVSMDN